MYELEDGEKSYEKAISGYDVASAHISSHQASLLEQDLHKIKSVKIPVWTEEGPQRPPPFTRELLRVDSC